MAGCSKKQYAIMMNSNEGKKLAAKMGGMSQDEFNKAFSDLLGSNYNQDEDEDYKEFDADDDSDYELEKDDELTPEQEYEQEMKNTHQKNYYERASKRIDEIEDKYLDDIQDDLDYLVDNNLITKDQYNELRSKLEARKNKGSEKSSYTSKEMEEKYGPNFENESEEFNQEDYQYDPATDTYSKRGSKKSEANEESDLMENTQEVLHSGEEERGDHIEYKSRDGHQYTLNRWWKKNDGTHLKTEKWLDGMWNAKTLSELQDIDDEVAEAYRKGEITGAERESVMKLKKEMTDYLRSTGGSEINKPSEKEIQRKEQQIRDVAETYGWDSGIVDNLIQEYFNKYGDYLYEKDVDEIKRKIQGESSTSNKTPETTTMKDFKSEDEYWEWFQSLSDEDKKKHLFGRK